MSINLPLIGITGYKNSGKDTAFKIILDKLPNVSILGHAFADPVKVLCSELFNLDIDLFYNQDKKEKLMVCQLQTIDPLYSVAPHIDKHVLLERFNYCMREYLIDDVCSDIFFISPREMMHVIATEVFRYFDDMVWINKAPVGNNVILTDVRFPNEAKYVTDHGGIILRIERDNYKHNEFSVLTSERHVDNIKYNYIIKTSGLYLEELKVAVDNFIQKVIIND